MNASGRNFARFADSGYRGLVDVMGMSRGGALAQQFARAFGRRCRRLALAV